jgi:gamma-glutamyltranspeptidase/glutathione hydrolase
VAEKLAAMGHSVNSANGADMGGVQSIMFVPEASPEKRELDGATTAVSGYYRAGSDFRKDGQAVGW